MYAPHKYTLWVLTGFAKTKKDKKEAPLISTHNISLLFSCEQKHLSLETVGRMANRFFFFISPQKHMFKALIRSAFMAQSTLFRSCQANFYWAGLVL